MRFLVVLVLLAGCRELLGFEDPVVAPDASGLTVGFEIAASAVDESSGTIEIAVVLSEPSDHAVTVDYSASGGDATNPDDFVETDGTIGFAPGQVRQVISLAIVEDTVEEPDERIDFTLSRASGASLGTAAHEITISANILPRVQFTVATASETEQTGTVTLVAQLDIPTPVDVEVDYELGGNATAGADYTLANGSFTFLAGTQTVTLPIPIVDDVSDEDDESIIVTLTNPSPKLIIGGTNASSIVITDNDVPPVVSFDPAEINMTAAEGDGGGTISFTYDVTLEPASGKIVTVPIVFSGQALNPFDYSVGTALPITFMPGVTRRGITLVILRDALNENNEQIVMTIGAATNATTGALTQRTHTIVDDD
ncbi:MAG: Calx-beta domain-containing protein [Kofleriaceae bacterium]